MYNQEDPYKNPQQNYYAQQQPHHGYGYGQYPPQGYYEQSQPIHYAQPVQHSGGNASVQEVTSLKPEQAPPTGWRDPIFAILFLVNVMAIFALMGVWGIKSFNKQEAENTNSFFSNDDVKTACGVTLGLSVIAIALSLGMVKLIITYAACMIRFTLWFNVGVSFAVAFYGFISGNFWLGIIGAFFALITLCYVRAVLHRIPFAVANLKVAAAAIKKHGSTHCVAFFITLFSVGWVLVWSLAMLGVMDQLQDGKSSSSTPAEKYPNGNNNGSLCTFNNQCKYGYCGGNGVCANPPETNMVIHASSASYAAFFFMLLSFYWGLQVFKNISHTAIAGTVATWWYSAESAGATGSSLKRACTTSLGSICFGSLLVAIIQVLRSMAESAKQEGNGAACLAECILGCLQSLVEYFNRWAYVYVGIYGYKFTQAGKAVFDLFHQRGFDAIINDDLVGNVLGFGALAVGLICAALGVLTVKLIDTAQFDNAELFLGIIGFILGIGIAIIPLSVIDSSVATIFVCFAEDPAAFQQSHPDLYQPLVNEWHALYPEIMIGCGYWRA